MKILVIDDDPMTVKFLQIFLVQEGYEVSIASSYKDALRVAKSEKPGVVITDISLPDGLGTDLIREMRAERSFVAICLSGYSSKQFAKDDTPIFDMEFSKPIDPNSLIDYLAETRSKAANP